MMILKTEWVESQIGRELTESERQTIVWLNGWERETALNVLTLIAASFENGFVRGVKR